MSLTTSIRNFMIRNGLFTDKVAPEKDILDAIQTVKPIDTGHNLIRIGGEGDGGYLVPDDLDGIIGCFSPGVSTIADFEDMLSKQYGIRSFLADYSVDAPPQSDQEYDFEKKYLGLVNDDTRIRLEDWISAKLGNDFEGDLILQMDIEGGEFEVLIDTPLSILRKFRILVIEFHAMERMFDKKCLPLVAAMFRKLRKEFSVAHIHPNNCCPVYRHQGIEIPAVFEVTFIRSDRLIPSERKLLFPHPLDHKNMPRKSDIILPKVFQ